MKGDKYIVTSWFGSWCLVNTRIKRKRITGPFRMSGVNYFDKAKEIAAERMGCSIDEVEYIPNFFNQ